MTTTATTLSIVLALVGAFLFACASVAQQREAAKVCEGDALMASLIRSPAWWWGIVGDLGGYGFQAAALAVGPVLIVQPLIVATLLFALPLTAIVSSTRVSSSTWVMAVVLAASLVAFLVADDPTEGHNDAPFRRWLVPGIVLIVLTLVTFGIGSVRTLRGGLRALALGATTGILFAITTVLTKPVLTSFSGADSYLDNIGRLLGDWRLWSLAVGGIAAMYMQQRAFQVGPLSASLPAITVGEPLIGAYLGSVVLNESVSTHGVRGVVVITSVVIMTISAIELARRHD